MVLFFFRTSYSLTAQARKCTLIKFFDIHACSREVYMHFNEFTKKTLLLVAISRSACVKRVTLAC